MKCPVDGVTLAMTERHGVEIDYCPECRGIWLDRGELDRIINNAGAASTSRPSGHADAPSSHDDDGRDGHHHDRDRERDDRDDDDRSWRQGRQGRKSRMSMLTDLLGGGGD